MTDLFGRKKREAEYAAKRAEWKQQAEKDSALIAEGRFFRDTKFNVPNGIPYATMFDAWRNLEERIAALEERKQP